MKARNVIALIEDNEDDIFLMKRALSGAGILNPLIVLEDGEQAIDYFAGRGPYADREKHPLPSIVFLDLKLPMHSGFDVLKAIRSREELEGLVVVVLTSSNEPTDVKASYALGANSYLVKPPTAAQLEDLAKSFKWYWLEYNEFAIPVRD